MISSLFKFALVALCLAACGPASVTGAASNPAQNDTAYAVQGEYLGINAATGDTEGAQVMAEGQDTFGLLLLDGGLPGRGWNGQGRQILSGGLLGNSAHFLQSGFNLSVDAAGDSLQGTNSQSQMLRLVKVHRQSPTLGESPPAGATVLFDGSSVSAWTHALLDSTHFLEADPAYNGASTIQSFGDFTLHVEFYLPFEPDNTDQGRANSGVYLQNRYELQILDSFGQSLADLAVSDTLEPKRQCGAFYEQVAPLVNMSFPPLVWQTYDINFTAAKWDSLGHKTQDAMVTIQQNGIVIHQNRALLNSTLEGNPEGPSPGPIFLQYHGHSVLFRNIWIVSQTGSTPILPASDSQGSLQHSQEILAPRNALAVPKTSWFVTLTGRLLKTSHLSN